MSRQEFKNSFEKLMNEGELLKAVDLAERNKAVPEYIAAASRIIKEEPGYAGMARKELFGERFRKIYR